MASAALRSAILSLLRGLPPADGTDDAALLERFVAWRDEAAFELLVYRHGPMVRRVCRDLGNKKNIIILSDEAHHCYRRKPDGEEESLSGDDRLEARQREEDARVWISGIEAVKAKIGVKAIYDLSATPFFLRGSGYSEGTLFPWVVSDFSLIDAIEAGIVKVPRVPVADDSMTGEQPTYRDLWLRIREGLPKKGRKTEAASGQLRAGSREAAYDVTGLPGVSGQPGIAWIGMMSLTDVQPPP